MVCSFPVVERNRRLRWGQLRAGQGKPYQLTGADVIWVARAALYEGGDVAATLWTLSQRFASVGRRNYATFADFVQAFSQPINPRYTEEGAYCRPGGRAHGTRWCSSELLARRNEARTASWSDLQRRNPEATATVLRWANAALSNPVPRAVNFAVPSLVAQNFPNATVVLESGNAYFAESWSVRWARDHVVITAPGGARAAASGVSAADTSLQALAVARDAMIYPWRVMPRSV